MNPNIHLIASMAYAEDRSCRLDLSKGVVVNERDYVSNLTRGIRDFWRYRGLPSFAHSQTLSPHYEGKFGCDAMIVVRHKDAARVCLFEAKWIRFDKPWDSFQKKSGISHFSDQLQRQSQWTEHTAIWELFIVGQKPRKQPPHFDPWASTCIWHKDTYEFDKTWRSSASLWKDSELEKLVRSISGKQKNLMAMLQGACQSKKGNYMPILNGKVRLTSSDGTDRTISIPAALQILDNLDILSGFCEENGIANFLFLEIDDDEG
jgi:hypothetical protein